MENKAKPSYLINEAQQFLAIGEQIQSESLSLEESERKEKLDALNELYRPWYRQALSLFSDFGRPELEKTFMDEFEGSWLTSKIKRFFEAGWKIYIYYDPDNPNPIIPKWTATYERSFKSPLERQCDLLSVLEISPSDSFNDLQVDKDVVIIEGDAWHQSYHQVLKDVNASSIEPKLKEIAVYDLEQAKIAYRSKAFKACIIMLGAVLEGIMLGTLRRIDVIHKMQTEPNPPPLINKLGLLNPQLADIIADKLTFEDYKNTIHHIIPELEKDKVENIQTFRNAVHPWKTVTDATIYGDPDKIRAINHITSLAISSRYILKFIA